MVAEYSEAQAVAAADWAGQRGRKWVEHLRATEAMLAPIDEPLIGALSLEGAKRVADIGCGGGRTTRALARCLPADALACGIDISADVIEAAREAADEVSADTGCAPGARVEFQCVDAGTAPPPSPPYDRLTSRFGVMFFDDPPTAFANLARWLQPGGRFAFAVWGPLADNPWMAHLRRMVAEEVEVPAPPPDSPGPFRYADATRFRAVLDGAGFADIAVDPWRGKVLLGGGVAADEASALSLSAFSVGDLLGHDAERVSRVRDRLTAILADYEVDGRVEVPASVHIVTGSR